MSAWLLDTGPIVAYLDARDPDHERVATAWDAFTGTFVTTSAVMTEAMHLLGADPEGPAALADIATASGLRVLDLTQPGDLAMAAPLMRKYRDIPMDFADATLLLAAEALELEDIFTLDRRGFTVFRSRPGRALRLVLPQFSP